jgi:hypothetical protein
VLPDRDTMQPIIGSFASNTAYVTQTVTSGAVSDVTVVGSYAQVGSVASNYADVNAPAPRPTSTARTGASWHSDLRRRRMRAAPTTTAATCAHPTAIT